MVYTESVARFVLSDTVSYPIIDGKIYVEPDLYDLFAKEMRKEVDKIIIAAIWKTIMKNVEVGIYKIHPEASIPEYATEGSACMDLRACCPGISVAVQPNETKLVPTGLCFDIPAGYKVELYCRSGMAAKYSLTVPNGPGQIDYDYVEEIKVIIHNLSNVPFIINHGDRIAQIAIEEVIRITPKVLYDKPAQKTDRNGGCGSTGVK